MSIKGYFLDVPEKAITYNRSLMQGTVNPIRKRIQGNPFSARGYYVNIYGYNGHTYAAAHTPPSSVTRTIVRLESYNYDVATASLD